MGSRMHVRAGCRRTEKSGQAELGRYHSPVLLGQILGVEVEDGQTSVGKLLEVTVLHGRLIEQESPRIRGALRVPCSGMRRLMAVQCSEGLGLQEAQTVTTGDGNGSINSGQRAGESLWSQANRFPGARAACGY